MCLKVFTVFIIIHSTHIFDVNYKHVSVSEPNWIISSKLRHRIVALTRAFVVLVQ